MPLTRRESPEAASFVYKVWESRAIWRHHQKMRVLSPLQAVNNKLAAARFAASLGVAVPKILQEPAPLDSLLPPLCDSFTLKPLRGTSGLGVLLLRREGVSFRNALSGATYPSWSAARDAAREEAKDKSSDFYLEETLLPAAESQGHLDDFKFYTFYGTVGLILQKRRLDAWTACYKWINPSWKLVTTTGRYLRQQAPELPAPHRKKELVEVAERLSAAVPAPFLRIDLYDTREAVVFGEFTPHPGGFHTFSEEWDAVLGRLYEEAAARLQIDVAYGRFDFAGFWQRIKSSSFK